MMARGLTSLSHVSHSCLRDIVSIPQGENHRSSPGAHESTISRDFTLMIAADNLDEVSE